MNMTVLMWPEWSSECPDVSDDDPARRITLYKKPSVGISYKCPWLEGKRKQDIRYEYGFYQWDIEIENPTQVLQMNVWRSLVRILANSKNPWGMIEKILSNHVCNYE